MVRSTVQFDRDDVRLLSGAIGSLLVHALVLSPMFMALPISSHIPAVPDRRDLTLYIVDPPPPEESPQLGIDQPMPPSRTWLGYEEYLEHLAQLAAVEQAAMTDDPTGMPVEPRPSADSPPLDLVPATQPPADTSREAMASEIAPTQAALEPAASPSSPSPIKLTRILESLALRTTEQEPGLVAEKSNDTASPDTEPIEDLVGRMLEAMQAPADDKPARPEPPEPRRAEAGDSTLPSSEAESPRQPPPPAVRSGPMPADPSDRDADPFSIIDVPVENWKLGRPLAAQGLELRPQRPTFTILTLLTAAPCNPLCEIIFRRDGKPGSARLIETSCDPRIDDAVLSSLYRWRASGQPLRDLQGDQTHAVRIRILLTRQPR